MKCKAHGIFTCPICAPVIGERKPAVQIDKANSMHLRDVAMNGIGAWLKLNESDWITYFKREATSKFEGDAQDAWFTINGKDYVLTVREVK